MPRVQATAPVARAPFGTTRDGQAVEVFTLTNSEGFELRAMTFGGVILSLRVPDRHGVMADVILGHDTLDGYLDRSPCFGAILGRYANRIAHGRFTIDGVEHQLTTNDGPHHLHGGRSGLDRVVWSAEPFRGNHRVGITLTYRSPDGDQGYPGSLVARVSYTLTDRNELVLDYTATTDRATPVNLTQHCCWNLAGSNERTVLDHELTINAAHYTPVDDSLIPTGAIEPVLGTPFDFRTALPVRLRITDDHEQLRNARGYDHNFVLSPAPDGALRHAVRLCDPVSGRVMDMHTTEPGIHFYSGNHLDGTVRGKQGKVYTHRSGLHLEAQHFPDSPNHPSFPSTILRPGAEYHAQTVFAFSLH